MQNRGSARAIYWIIGIIVVLIALYFIINAFTQKSQTVTDVTFPVSWVNTAQYAYVYIAQEKGYFAEEGINVTITQNLGSSITSQLIASGQVPIGMVGADIAMISVSKGLPLTVVAIADKANPSGVTCFKDSNVSKPKDLEGKKIGVTITSNSYQAYLSFVKKEGLDRSKIEEIPISGAGSEWLAGKTDCQALYPFLSVPAAESKGFNVTHLDYADYGLEMYNQAVVANSNVLKSNPELIHKVTRAVAKGIAYERAHPDEVEKLIAKTPYDSKVFELRMALDKRLPDPSKAGDGLADKDALIRMKDTLNGLGLLQTDVNIDTFYTDKFIK